MPRTGAFQLLTATIRIGLGCALGATLSGAATAAEDDIIVTARKVREDVRDVPASVTVVSARTADVAGLRTLPDLTRVVPNVTMSGGIAGIVQGQLAIRGIATLVRNVGLESGAGIYVDGIYLGRPETYNQELLDVAQVEVLRGPQGTLFGKNTIAGVFNVITAAPTATAQARARLELGSDELVRAQVAISGPVAGETLQGRIAVGYASRDGFAPHASGGADADSLDLLSWRGALAAAPAEGVTLTLRTDGLRDRGTPGFFQKTELAFPVPPLTGSPRRIDNNRPNRLDRDVDGVSLTATAALGTAELTSISSYRHSSFDASLDDDQRQIDLLGQDDFADDTDLVTQELRLAGPLGGGIRYLVGVYYLDQSTKTDRALGVGTDLAAYLSTLFPFPVPAGARLTTRGKVTTRSYAAFANLDWRLADPLTLSAGLRYTHERKRARFVQDDEAGIFTFLGLPDLGFAGRASDEDLSPTVSLTYMVTPEVNLYGRVAKGFKSAAFNVDLANSPGGLAAGPEKATSYEAGIKAGLFGNRLRGGITAFHTDYDDLQVAQLTGGGVTLTNAGKASIDGVEAEVETSLFDPLRLEASAGYTDAKYDRFGQCALPQSVGVGATDCAGNRLTAAPRYTAHGAIEYRRPLAFGSLLARVDVSHQSSVYFEPTNSARFKGGERTLLSARLGVEAAAWSAYVWADNLTDELYETYMDDRSTIGVLHTTAYGAPRTWGVTLSTSF